MNSNKFSNVFPKSLLQPFNIFTENKYSNKLVLVILKSAKDINCHQSCFYTNIISKFHENCTYSVVADGAIEFIDYINSQQKNAIIPNLIAGDLDSAPQALLNKYSQLGSLIVKYEDQNQTDFTKCLRLLGKILKGNLHFLDVNDSDIILSKPIEFIKNENDIYDIYVIGGLSGRFDHIIGAINTLYIIYEMWKKSDQQAMPNIFLMSFESIVTLLVPNVNYEVDISSGLEDKTCGIIPFSGKCNGIMTQGLKWDLKYEDIFNFGELISTSNQFLTHSKSIKILSLYFPIIWTMEINTQNMIKTLK